MRTGGAPARRWLPSVLRRDVALPAAILVVELVGTYWAGRYHLHRQPGALEWLLVVAGPVALVFRRRYPVAVLWTVFAATLAYALLGYPYGAVFISLVVAFFSAATRGHRLGAWPVLPLGFVSFTWLVWLAGAQGRPSLATILALAAWHVVLLVVAEVARMRRERVAEAQAIRQAEDRRRAGEERLRMARELHDVLGHHLSLITVQAGVGLDLMDEQPEQARTALQAIRDVSKEALGELRSVLAALREAGEIAPRSPTAGLSGLDELIARATTAGLTVATEVSGQPRPLPAGTDLAAYRIVQEALTNVARHAGPQRATVLLAYGRHDLVVQIDNDGPTSGGTPGSGSGIRGMRDRAEALGGHLEAGPRPGGGFRVLARLPSAGPPTTGPAGPPAPDSGLDRGREASESTAPW